MTRIAICGDNHGHFDLMYEKAQALNPDVIIQVGDTGMFPNPEKADDASKRHGVPVDFIRYLKGEKKIPVKTYLFQGNHEDFDFLEGKDGEIIPGLIFVPQGRVIRVNGTRFGVLGGNYSPTFYNADRLSQSRRRHFTRRHVEAIEQQGFDVLLSHDGPKTCSLPRGCQEITDLIERTQPSYAYHGHHHYSYETNIGDTKVVGLDKVDSQGRCIKVHGN